MFSSMLGFQSPYTNIVLPSSRRVATCSVRGQGGVPLTVGQEVHKSVRVKIDEFLHSVLGHILHPMLNQSTNHQSPNPYICQSSRAVESSKILITRIRRRRPRIPTMPRKRKTHRAKIEEIYKQFNPSKLDQIDELMVKYEGKESQLLKAIQQKYGVNTDNSGGAVGAAAARPSIDISSDLKKCTVSKSNSITKKDSDSDRKCKSWIYTLKNYEHNNKYANKKTDASLKEFRKILDDFASSIGGECADVISKWGHRQHVVRQSQNPTDWKRAHLKAEDIEFTVQKMRKVIHDRYEHIRKGTSIANLHADEHDRRSEEKRVDQMKKKARDKCRRTRRR